MSFWLFSFSSMIMKPWQTSLNKALSKWGKGGTKREDPSQRHKNKTQIGSQWEHRNKSCSKAPHQSQEAYHKEKPLFPSIWWNGCGIGCSVNVTSGNSWLDGIRKIATWVYCMGGLSMTCCCCGKYFCWHGNKIEVDGIHIYFFKAFLEFSLAHHITSSLTTFTIF